MKNEKIYKGLKVLGIKTLCEILGEKYDSKHNEANKKRVGQYCDFHYEGKFVIVDEVFEIPKLYKKNSYKHKYEVGDVLFPNYGALLVNEKKYITHKNGKRSRGYDVTCQICRYQFDILESTLDQMGGCSVCSHHKVLKGYNDMWTTNQEMASWLANPEEGYLYAEKSNKKLNWKCPDCGYIIENKTPATVENQGLACPKCSDGISYPNKFMFNVLTQLNEDFTPEKKFDWCIFKKYNSNEDTYGLYDFVIENKKLIIEMDGGLNHKDGKAYKNDEEKMKESLYKDHMKDVLAEKNGYTILRIDCKYFDIKDRKEKCIDGIINSELNEIYNFNNVDWNMAHTYSLKSKVYEVCTLYNNGLLPSQISNIVKLSITSIYNYLQQGNESGLCNYTNKIILNKKFLQGIGYIINNKKELEDAKLDYICSYYNEHNDMLLDEISENIKVCRTTLWKYLKKGAELGLCNYSVEESVKQSKIKSGETRRKVDQEFPDKAFGDFFNLELDETNK